MTAATNISPDDLLRQLQRLQKVAKRLLQLEGSSQQAIKSNDLITTEAVLNQKQPLIDELLGVKHLRELYDQSMKSHPANQSPLIESALQEIHSCLATIWQAEQETIDFAREQHRTTAAKLQALAQNHKASKTYQQPKQTSPGRRIDISG